MLTWTIKFFLGLEQPPGKTGKREVATWCFCLWCYGFLRLGMREAEGISMPLTADVLKITFPFVAALLVGAFGMEQLANAGWLTNKKDT